MPSRGKIYQANKMSFSVLYSSWMILILLYLAPIDSKGQPPDILVSGYVVGREIATESSEQYFLANQATLAGSNFTKIYGQTVFNTTLYSDERRRECYRNSILIASQLPVLMGREPEILSELFASFETGTSLLSMSSSYSASIRTHYIKASELGGATHNFISKYLRRINPKSYGGVKIVPTNLERLGNSLQALGIATLSLDIAYKAVFMEALASDLALTNLSLIEQSFASRINSGEKTDPVIILAINDAREYLDRADVYWGALVLEMNDRLDEIASMGLDVGLDYIRKNYLKGALTKYYAKIGKVQSSAHGAWSSGLWTLSLWLTYETIDAILDQHQKMQTGITSATLAALLKEEMEKARLPGCPLTEAMIIQAEYDYYYHMVQVHSGVLPYYRDIVDNLVYGEKYNMEWKEHFKDVSDAAETALRDLDIFNFPDFNKQGGIISLGFIIDSSGSMNTSDPFNIRKSAMKQIIDLIRPDDYVFIVDFDDKPAWINSRNWNNFNRELIKTEIEGINSDGGTEIGLALLEMKSILESHAGESSGAVLLLSDGKSNYSDEAEWFSKNGVPVYSISYKNIANSDLLNKIAITTGGLYLGANTDGEVVSAFMQFYNDLHGGEKIVSSKGLLTTGDVAETKFDVDFNSRQIIGNITFNSGDLDIRLTSPGGVVYSEGNVGEWYSGTNYSSVKIENPEGGRWSATLTAKDDLSSQNMNYRFEVSGITPNPLHLESDPVTRGILKYELNDINGGYDLAGINPNITVTTPADIKLDISGNYSNGSFSFMPRHGPGNYRIDIELKTTDKTGKPIQRYISRSAYIGENTPSYMAEIKSVTGSVVRSELGQNTGNQPGIRCSIYSVENGKRIKKAEGYVTFVTRNDCQIEILEFFSGYAISPKDIVELDYVQWKGDNSK